MYTHPQTVCVWDECAYVRFCPRCQRAPLPRGEKQHCNIALPAHVCVLVCVCVRVGCVLKGKALGFLCKCVSSFSSLSKVLFLDQFEGQGLATGGETQRSRLKGGGGLCV